MELVDLRKKPESNRRGCRLAPHLGVRLGGGGGLAKAGGALAPSLLVVFLWLDWRLADWESQARPSSCHSVRVRGLTLSTDSCGVAHGVVS